MNLIRENTLQNTFWFELEEVLYLLFFFCLETASKCKLHSRNSLLFCWVGKENWLLFSLSDTDVENSDMYLSFTVISVKFLMFHYRKNLRLAIISGTTVLVFWVVFWFLSRACRQYSLPAHRNE